MRSEEAQVGKRVRVGEHHPKAYLRDQRGTIVKSWGDPSYVALDVLLDGGNRDLFWYHELEEVDEEDREARPRDRITAWRQSG